MPTVMEKKYVTRFVRLRWLEIAVTGGGVKLIYSKNSVNIVQKYFIVHLFLLTEVVKGKLFPTRLETATEDGIENGWLLVFTDDGTAAPDVEPDAIEVNEADDTGGGGGELRTSDKEVA